MKISEYVEKLNTIKEKYGDLDVMVFIDSWAGDYSVEADDPRVENNEAPEMCIIYTGAED